MRAIKKYGIGLIPIMLLVLASLACGNFSDRPKQDSAVAQSDSGSVCDDSVEVIDDLGEGTYYTRGDLVFCNNGPTKTVTCEGTPFDPAVVKYGQTFSGFGINCSRISVKQ